MSTTKKPLLMRSSRSSIRTNVLVGGGSTMSETRRITLNSFCPSQASSLLSQLFIDTLRTRGSSLPPCFDMLLSAGQRHASRLLRYGQRWLVIRYTVFVLSGTEDE